MNSVLLATNLICLISAIVASLIAIYAAKKAGELYVNNDKLVTSIREKAAELSSLRVKHGQYFQMVFPFCKPFADLGPTENFVFIGGPIDGLYFNDDEIIFVEAKTGNARLSQRQMRAKALVKKGKVRWVEVNDEDPTEEEIT